MVALKWVFLEYLITPGIPPTPLQKFADEGTVMFPGIVGVCGEVFPQCPREQPEKELSQKNANKDSSSTLKKGEKLKERENT